MPVREVTGEIQLDPVVRELPPDAQIDVQAASASADPVMDVAPGLRRAQQQASEGDRPFKSYTGERVPEEESRMLTGRSPEQIRLAGEIAASLIEIPGLSEAARAALGVKLAGLASKALVSGGASAGASAALGGTTEEALTAGATGAAGTVVGAGLAKGIEAAGTRLLAPFVETVEKGAQKTQEILGKAGILTPGKATTSPILATLESAADMSIIGASKIGKETEQAQTVLTNKVNDLVDAFRSQATREEVGELVQQTIENSADAFREAGRANYAAVDRAFGNTLVDITALKQLATNLAGRSEKGLGSPEVKRITDAIIERPDAVDWEVAQILRSDLLGIGRNATELVQGRAKGAAEELAGGMDRAMASAAKDLSGDALAAWRAANTFWKEGTKTFNSQLIRTIARREPEAVFDAVVRNGKPGTIRRVREILPPGDWRAVQGQYLDDLVRKSTDETGERLDGVKFLNGLKKMGDGLDELFPDAATRQGIVDLGLALRLAQKRPSAAAINLGMAGNLASVAGSGYLSFSILQDVRQGNVSAATIAALPAAVALNPRSLGALLTNPTAVKWLTTGLKYPPRSKEGIEAAAKLGGFLIKEGLAEPADIGNKQ